MLFTTLRKSCGSRDRPSRFWEYFFPAPEKFRLQHACNLFVTSYYSVIYICHRKLARTLQRSRSSKTHIMKTTTAVSLLALAITATSSAIWLFASPPFSPDIIMGAYSIAGLLFIAATEYAPRRPLTLPRKAAMGIGNWTRHSLHRSSQFGRRQRVSKIAI